MKISSIKKVLCASLLLAITAPQANAGFGLPNFIKRYELGFSYSMAFANYTNSVATTTGDGQTFVTNMDMKVRSSFGYGGIMGTYIPITRVGKSVMAIGVDLNYNMFVWNYNIPQYQSNTTDVNGNITGVVFGNDVMDMPMTGVSMQVALPVSLDFKFGAEASLLRGTRWTGTIGAGAYPAVSATADYGNAGFGFGVVPFAKAEVGVLGGIYWKLRVQYAAGNMPFYTKKNNILQGPDANNSELIGKGIASVSLVLMPFSWNFNEDGWWNWHH